MSLYDILACPLCKTAVQPMGESLRCVTCGRDYPIVSGVPIMMPDVDPRSIKHDAELLLREGYDPWVHRMTLQSFTDAQVVLDAGSGNMKLDDPCIIRMDVTLTPYVDVVGDLHALPFKLDSLDFIFSLAVIEHLRQPFKAAEEMYAALKPGGYVYGECNFVFAYHGYPHHYFNASIHGLKQVFHQFHELRLGVAPYQTPAFALEHILGNYLTYFRPQTPAEMRFANLMRQLLAYPIRRYDARLDPAMLYRLAAGVHFLGVKQPTGMETIIPSVIWGVYQHSVELQARYPDPINLAAPDNLMMWAKTEGRQRHAEIERYFADLRPFSKYADPTHRFDRTHVHHLPAIPDPDHQRIEEPNYDLLEAEAEQALSQLIGVAGGARVIAGRSKWTTLKLLYQQRGWTGAAQELWQYAWRHIRARS